MRGNGVKVLVVEDDPEARFATVRLLEQLGFTAISADGADEARMRLLHFAAELALIDAGTHHLRGLELARELRQQYPALGIILTTSRPESPGREFPLLRSPFKLDELLVAMQDATV
jgi:DNA-binding response OmpR family regulator